MVFDVQPASRVRCAAAVAWPTEAARADGASVTSALAPGPTGIGEHGASESGKKTIYSPNGYMTKLQLQSSGEGLSGLKIGPVHGVSVHPNTVRRRRLLL